MAGDEICFPCSVGTTHICPICQAVVSGSAPGPCFPCSKEHHFKRLIAREAATIPHKWLAKLFTEYGTEAADEVKATVATGRIARAAAACRQIALMVPHPDDLTTDALYAALGAGGLQRVSPMITYMTEVGAVKLDRARIMNQIEEDRVTQALVAYGEGPHRSLLKRYRNDLADRVRMSVTQRTAVTAAVDLLAELGDAPLAKLSQLHIKRTLHKGPEHRDALHEFLCFIEAQGGPILALPTPSRAELAANEKWQRDAITWRKRLEYPASSREARALIAVLIARLYALPLSRVLTLRREDVAFTPAGVTLWPKADALILEEPLADAFDKGMRQHCYWSLPMGQYLLGDECGMRIISEAMVAKHLTDAANYRRIFSRPGFRGGRS